MPASLYEQMGGDRKLRAIIDRFVDRMRNDLMIGFFFERINLKRLKELEFQHAAAWLGAAESYRGRPLDTAHGPHAIAGGHFARRLQILKEVLVEMEIAPELRAAWLAHQESLRELITGAKDNGCDLPHPGGRGA